MIELIYPVDDLAPMLPAKTAEQRQKLTRAASREEIFPVINENGTVIGRAERSYCHNGSHLLHPVVHLHIIDRNKRLYLQKRSMKKDLLPGKWDTAVGGHIMYGEGIVEALRRESSEELSFYDFDPIYIESYKWETERDAEFVNVFAAVGSFKLLPDKEEVECGKWWNLDELEDKLDTGVFTPNFVSEYMKIRDRLLTLL